MKLYMPTKVIAEQGCVKKMAGELAALGTKAMIVTGKHSSRKNGSLTDITEALKQENREYVIFDEVEENPSVETVVKAAKLAVKEKVDFFIGVGGGSPMDSSKAISLLAKNIEYADTAEEMFYTKVEREAYPVAAVPTTSGTGSEVTPYAILTLHSQHTKKSIAHLIFPKLALVDYSYLKTSGYANTVSTCVDALAHLIESYLNTNANEYNRMYAREGLCIWGSQKQALLPDAGPLTDRNYQQFMHASVIAGMAISHTGTSLPHGLSYPVTYEMHVPHGKAVGIFLPGFLKNYGNQEEVQAVLGMLGFVDIETFTTYIKTILGTVEISEELWEQDMEGILKNPAKLKNYPFPLTKEELKHYLGENHAN